MGAVPFQSLEKETKERKD